MKTWNKNKRLIFILTSIWFLTTLIAGIAPKFLRFNFFGWEFTYWWAAQGALLIYLLLTWVYALMMQKYEKEALKSPDL
jgi:putative solute:sodium symporter small subunit